MTERQKKIFHKNLLQKRHKRKNKKILIDYKGGKCERCGYEKEFLSVYHFHHINPKEKSFNVSSYIGSIDVENLKLEVDKCQLLCGNCHAEVHETEYLIEREESKRIHKNWLEKINDNRNIICLTCGKEFVLNNSKIKSSGNYCSRKCYLNYMVCRINGTSNLKPSKEQLEKLLWEKPTIQLAKDFGVSDKAIEKWAKKYGLSKQPRGYWRKIECKK